MSFLKRAAPGKHPVAGLSYISEDFVGAIILRPREILSSPLVQALSGGALDAIASPQGLGVDPLRIEQLLILGGTPHGQAGSFGVVIRFAEPVDGRQLLERLVPKSDEVYHFDKSYQRSRDPARPSVHVADERTIVLAPHVQLERMLRADSSSSMLKDLLSRSHASSPVMLLFALEPVREIVLEELAKSPPLPPPYDRFEAVPHNLSSLEVYFDPLGRTPPAIVLEGRGAAAADLLERLAGDAIDLARSGLSTAADQAFGGPTSDGNQPRPAASVWAELLDQLQVGREDRRVALELPAAQSPRVMMLTVSGLRTLQAARARFAAAANLPGGPGEEVSTVDEPPAEEPQPQFGRDPFGPLSGPVHDEVRR